jgi:mannose-6-phosphate isomerase-like protein (cupin superfamily)
VLTRRSANNTYQYGGGTVSILLSAEETGGVFSAWESVQKPGNEPPLHVHYTADETFFILEGEMRILVGGNVVDAPAGSVVFAPRGVPHTFRIKSEKVRAVTICTPAGFEEWFREMGRPAESLEPSAMPAGPPDFGKIAELSKKLQVQTLGEVEF